MRQVQIPIRSMWYITGKTVLMMKEKSYRRTKMANSMLYMRAISDECRMLEVIVRAAAEIANHPEIQFDIYGNGALKETCMMLAQELHATNVTFFDPVPAAEAHSLYENADLNIVPLAKNIIKTALPSKTAVCIECGKPVIFAIGETSMTSKMISERESAKVIESDDFIGMTKLIVWFCNNRNKAAEEHSAI